MALPNSILGVTVVTPRFAMVWARLRIGIPFWNYLCSRILPAYQPIDPNQVADSGGPDGGNGRATAIRPVMRR